MIKKITDDTFIAEVYLVTGDDLEKYYQKKAVDEGRQKPDELDGFVQRIDLREKNALFREYLIYIEDEANFYTLLHETVHLVNQILVDRNIWYDPKIDELFAYYQTYWFKRLWRAINKKKPAKKKS